MARSYYETQYNSMKAELERLQRSTEVQWLNRYIRFINETGKRSEFLLWAAKDIGFDPETIGGMFPATHQTPNAETIAAMEEADAGGGEVFHGSAEAAIAKVLADDPTQSS